MAEKEIRVTFFYADEAIFDRVKQEKIRERFVKWADEFYKRYGFTIDEFPIPFSETLYKKSFCLAKTDGIKPDYTGTVYERILKEILKQRQSKFDADNKAYEKKPPD